MNIAEGDAQAIRLLLHRGETALIGIRAAADHDLFARLGMKHRKRLGAAGNKQAEEEKETIDHKRVLD